MIRAHQPGSQPIDIPEVIPNPAVVPKQEPAPKEPAPKTPVNVPEKVAKIVRHFATRQSRPTRPSALYGGLLTPRLQSAANTKKPRPGQRRGVRSGFRSNIALRNSARSSWLVAFLTSSADPLSAAFINNVAVT
jgi:hypothetical protein